ncbi:MAG: hypothetical protein ACRC0V_07570 [Fusobacteriaceae bacterium]
MYKLEKSRLTVDLPIEIKIMLEEKSRAKLLTMTSLLIKLIKKCDVNDL